MKSLFFFILVLIVAPAVYITGGFTHLNGKINPMITWGIWTILSIIIAAALAVGPSKKMAQRSTVTPFRHMPGES